MEILCEYPWSWIQVHPEPFQYFFHEPQHSHSQGWPRQEPRETRTWLIEFSKPISVKGTRLLCRSPPLAPESSSICAVAKSSMGGGWGGSRTSSGTLSREHGCPWNRDIPCRPVQHFQQRRTDFWGKNSQGFDLAGSGMWLLLLSHHALWKEAVGADDKGSSQLWIFCSFLLCVGFIPPLFAYHTSQIPEKLLPTAIILILIANNHILVCWRQEVPSCCFRDCWALIDFYVMPVKCSWFHYRGQLTHRE